ncbi:MAG TPA: TonB C-terminal domain-containing protein [Candidatus Melainabacteria bacterium]|nr:TonB C-terminal domain-containing protein [Candidatus Melainabacteria bacterium]HMP51131.1 TonB C-terminal domain-containing protein [Candidatus Melainabacteria bacterium]
MKATLCIIALIFISGCFSQASAKSEDLAPEMKNWHGKITAGIYDRFSQRIKSTDLIKEQKFSCSVQYTVTAKGTIKNIHVTRPSDNKAFDKLVVSCLRSFSGDPLLKFPPGTKESQIQKTGVFLWNAGKNRDLPAFLRGENDTYEGVDTNDCETLRTPQMLQE